MSNCAHHIMILSNNKRKRLYNQENRDRLSDLPDCVLLHILSYLNTTKRAVQTCILSTRWKHLWKRVPNFILHYSDFDSVRRFAVFVSQILKLRDSSTALRALNLVHRSLEPQLLKKIMKYVHSHNTHIQQLRINVTSESCSHVLNCISSCRALTSLKLSLYSRGIDNNNREILFPKSLNLPLLTSLELENVVFCGGKNGCAEPFSSCTKLNSLVIRFCNVKDAQILSVSNKTLVNLDMRYNPFRVSKIELSTPSLCTFSFPSTLDTIICGSGLSCVKQVNIGEPRILDSVEHPLVLLSRLQDFANVESLEVTSTALQILSLVPDLLEVKLLSLCNLKSLEIELTPLHVGILFRSMKDAMLEKAAAKSQKEVAKLRKAFKAGLEPPPIPDGIVDFLRQNSPSAEVNILTGSWGCFDLEQVKDSVKGAKIMKYHSKFAAPACATAAAPPSASDAPPNLHLCSAKEMVTNIDNQNFNTGSANYVRADNDNSHNDIEEAECIKCRERQEIQVKDHTDCSLTKCVVALEEIKDISDDIYGKALEKFKDPDWREMFMAMSNDRKHGWLFRLQA